MVINLRQNTNDDSTAFGKYFAEVDAKEPLNLKGLAKHMLEHGKISSEEMCNLVLGEMVKCLVHLLREGQPVKLDGFGTFSPSVDGQGLGKNDVETAVAGGADAMINGIRINFTPENTKGEQLTSRALKKECVFEWGYVVESEVRTIGGKKKRFQKKTPISYAERHPHRRREAEALPEQDADQLRARAAGRQSGQWVISSPPESGGAGGGLNAGKCSLVQTPSGSP